MDMETVRETIENIKKEIYSMMLPSSPITVPGPFGPKRSMKSRYATTPYTPKPKRIKAKPTFPKYEVAPSFEDASEFCQAFVYSKSKGNMLFTGRHDSVKRYIKDLLPDQHYFVNYTFWRKRRIFTESSNIWEFGYEGITVIKPRKKMKMYKYIISGNRKWSEDNAGLTCPQLKFKRMPNKWIRDFDFLVCTS